MDTIDQSKVVSQANNQIRMAVTYYFTSFDESPGRGANLCQGFNTRFFTRPQLVRWLEPRLDVRRAAAVLSRR